MSFLRIWLWIVVACTVALAQKDGFAVMTKPAANEAVPGGSTYKIVWAAGSGKGKVTLSLIGGSSQATLQPIGDIASGVDVTTGFYNWAVPADEGSLAVYGIKITSEADPEVFQYSFPFQIKSGKGATTTSSATAKSTSATKSITSTTKSATTSTSSVKTSSASSSSSSSTSSASSTTTVPSPIPSKEQEPASDTSTQNAATSSPLSTAAIVGIAAGGALLLGIVTAVALFFRRRWQLIREQDRMEYARLMEERR